MPAPLLTRGAGTAMSRPGHLGPTDNMTTATVTFAAAKDNVITQCPQWQCRRHGHVGWRLTTVGNIRTRPGMPVDTIGRLIFYVRAVWDPDPAPDSRSPVWFGWYVSQHELAGPNRYAQILTAPATRPLQVGGIARRINAYFCVVDVIRRTVPNLQLTGSLIPGQLHVSS